MGRFAVTYDDLVQNVEQWRVVKDGTVQNVERALVVCDGVARQFWPRTDFSTSVVTWTTTPLTAIDVVADPLDAQAAIQFLLADGNAYLDQNPPGGSLQASYVSPPITATGQLLLRWNTVSGSVLSNVTENVWFDMYSNGGAFIASVYLDQTVVGAGAAEVDIEIAPDSGGGVPGAIVTKRVTFHAEVTSTTGVIMSTVPWSLEHITVNADAECIIDLMTDLQVRGYEGLSLAEQEAYAPALSNPSDYTAQLDLVSGTAPTSGPALATPHPLSATVEWKLEATVALDDFTGVYDLTVDGPVNTVVKRITCHSARTDDLSGDLVWTATPELILEGNVPEFTSVTMGHNIDGTSSLTAVGFTGPGGWPQNWDANAPTPTDPENYEVNMRTVSGTAPSGSALDTWLPADSAYSWVWDGLNFPTVNSIVGAVDWSYRRIGQPSTEVKKRISVSLSGGDPI